MTAEKANLLQDVWKTKHGSQVCSHSRIIEPLEPKNQRNGYHVVCRECGSIILDPYNSFAVGMTVHVA
ncbi:hypothetical protein [Candidatus Nitronereus thalassa]|uniref:Uncharacterized protein n=1 Tax=Candidatus Nitronereus thalassa TaxID=3020898 RepID=A0ABU3K8Q9_9BACT|nr:hypothetical protein [Candidatus Nitronereus thalassa]MDT7042785.1 hypothetical protein [Candidatus Nitronereus thalassa]